MGTNYYARLDTCPHCGHPREELHIGKSSYGWCFALHVYPERGIHDLPDWEALWKKPTTAIFNGYNESLTAQEMLAEVTERVYTGRVPASEEYLRENCATRGPNNLLRDVRARPGTGTWDCCEGDFS